MILLSILGAVALVFLLWFLYLWIDKPGRERQEKAMLDIFKDAK